MTARGNERKAIYRSDADRRHFVDLLAEMVSRYRVRLHGYVLMENHYHLLLELQESNLSRALQWLNVSYSVWFNRRHGRTGHLFQGRFKSIAVSSAEWGLELSRYVHLNPVRTAALGSGKRDRQAQKAGASTVPDPKAVQERLEQLRTYRWSSYRAYVGLEQSPAWLECETILKLGGRSKLTPPRRYLEYVEEAVREGLERSPWDELREQVLLGGAQFLAGVKQVVQGHRQEQRGARRLVAVRPKFDAVVAAIERVKGEKWSEFRDRHGDRGRDMALHLGQKECGLKLTELAAAVGLENYAVVSTNVRRYEEFLKTNRAEQSRMKHVLQLITCEM